MDSSNTLGISRYEKRKRRCSRLSGLVGLALLLASPAAWGQEEPASEEATVGEANAAPEAQTPEPAAVAEPSGPHTANKLQLGLGFRYGVMLNDGEPDPWGSGLGIDVGYTLPNAIYLGAGFEYFFGSTSEALGYQLSSNLWQLSAEAGYDLGLGQNFVIRPKVGFGVAGVSSKITGCGAGDFCEELTPTSSATKAAIAPGAVFLLFTRSFSLSLDIRYDIVLVDPALKGLIFSVGVGF